MKYDIDLSSSDVGASHAIVAELVGSGNRVLDVGCSTGYLARLLKYRGNRVSGIEIDVEAANQAEPDLEKLVVGDIESLDLGEHFEESSFDVLVLADVLEHLRDPISVLRRLRSLLAPSGSIVVLLPNIAHGSVRLALLEGRFEYRPLGLLDETHLRFFTRSGVEDLLRGAELIAVDMRRTVVDTFATEIPLSPDRFSSEVVQRVRSEPDSDTYQFVFRAIPADDAGNPQLGRQLVARNEELQALRAQVEEILAASAGYGQPHVVAVVAGEEGYSVWDSMRFAITARELSLRLRTQTIRLAGWDRAGGKTAWTGEPIESWSVGDPVAADLVAQLYDAVVFTNPRLLEGHERVLADLDERGCPRFVAGSAQESTTEYERSLQGFVASRPSYRSTALSTAPDPLVLAHRLVDSGSLALRLDFLRITGRVEVSDGYILAAVGSTDEQANLAFARTVANLAQVREAPVVVLPAVTDRDTSDLQSVFAPSTVLEPPDVVDVLALIGGAALIVTDSATVTAVALSLNRPVVAVDRSREIDDLAKWMGAHDFAADSPADIVSRADLAEVRAQDLAVRSRLESAIDLAYDELGSALTGCAATKLSMSTTQILVALQSRVGDLERANLALQARLVHERNALAMYAKSVLQTADEIEPGAPQGLSNRVITAEKKAISAQRKVDEYSRELEALKSTKSMRLLAPGRRIYGRIRRLP